MIKIIFYDFECFSFDWLVVLMDTKARKETVIVNDKDKLEKFYDENKDDIWVGYNSRNYDQYILKAILCGFDAKKVNDWIIVEGKKGWSFSKLLNKIPLINYDCMSVFHGLKQLEAFMGNDIRETSVPFDIDRKLSFEELEETIKYCRHDVEQTMEVFMKKKNEFNAIMDLIKTFNLPLSYVGKTKAQLAAIILGATKRSFDDEYDIRIPDNLRLSKYKKVAEWFLTPATKDKTFYSRKLETDVAGVPHDFGWGGVHGAIDKFHCKVKPDEIMIMADVDQLYPSIMIQYNLLSRAVNDPKKFEQILNTSLQLKKEKKKKQREPYKLICNITYGSEGDSTNAMFDPLHRNLVCVFGQLFLLMLIEMLEKQIPSFQLIQSNTDGILFKIKNRDFDLVDDVVYEWEKETRLHMSFDYYTEIFQKDVNNYVAIDENGGIKSKGAYVKDLNDLDYDLPIVNRAMIDFMVKGVPVEKTINSCDVLRDFQKVVKVSSKYYCGQHNGKQLNDKTFRVFASIDPRDTPIFKLKSATAKPEKFANTPDSCFIENGNINGVSCPKKLDKKFYIDLANKRLQQFGVI